MSVWAANLDQEGYRDENRKYEHAAQAVQVEGPSAAAIHQRYRHQRHENHHRTDAYCGIFGRRFTQSRRDEQIGGVVEDSVDAGQLLRQLHHNGNRQRHAQRRRAQQLKHRYLRLGLLGLLLGAHLLNVVLNVGRVAQAAQRVPRRLLLPLGDEEVARGLGTDGEQDELEDGGEDGDAEEVGPAHVRAEQVVHPQHLAGQQAHGHRQLVDSAQAAAEVERRNLGYVHRHQAGVQSWQYRYCDKNMSGALCFHNKLG